MDKIYFNWTDKDIKNLDKVLKAYESAKFSTEYAITKNKYYQAYAIIIPRYGVYIYKGFLESNTPITNEEFKEWFDSNFEDALMAVGYPNRNDYKDTEKEKYEKDKSNFEYTVEGHVITISNPNEVVINRLLQDEGLLNTLLEVNMNLYDTFLYYNLRDLESMVEKNDYRSAVLEIMEKMAQLRNEMLKECKIFAEQ